MEYSSTMREVLLGSPKLDLNQMLRVERGEERVPLDWPSNWQFLLLINQIVDMVESHEIEIEQYIRNAAKARVLFDDGAVYAPKPS